jgi:hypothetical protein
VTRLIIADTGGLLRALARMSDGKPSFPEYEAALTEASLVIVPGLVLAEVDYFWRRERVAMRKLQTPQKRLKRPIVSREKWYEPYPAVLPRHS